MNESTKALRRRWCEDAAGVFPWRSIFKGRLLDVGAGDDPLPFPNCVPFDKQDGNAEQLSTYFDPESFDLVHGSHVVEHLQDPEQSLRDWVTLLKPNGHLVWTVPDVGAYERFIYPSKNNADHKASFSMIYRGSAFPKHYHIPTLCDSLSDVVETLLARYIERNYDWNRPEVDQTFETTEGTEIWNEVVMRKK